MLLLLLLCSLTTPAISFCHVRRQCNSNPSLPLSRTVVQVVAERPEMFVVGGTMQAPPPNSPTSRTRLHLQQLTRTLTRTQTCWHFSSCEWG